MDSESATAMIATAAIPIAIPPAATIAAMANAATTSGASAPPMTDLFRLPEIVASRGIASTLRGLPPLPGHMVLGFAHLCLYVVIRPRYVTVRAIPRQAWAAP